MKIIALTILIALAGVTSGSAAQLYVATTGSDGDPGTELQPFATIGKGAATAQAGDTVWIKPGIYQPTAPVRPANSGTSTSPITFRAQAGGQVIIDGQSTVPTIASREGLFFVSGKNWIVIDGLRIINSGFFGILIKDTSSNVTVRNCSTFFTYASGICAANSSNIKVLNNSVQQACMAPPATPRTQVSECITMASVNTFEVAYNTVSDRPTNAALGGEGIDAKNACSNGSIHHNVVHDLIGLGLYIDAYAQNLSDVEMHSNVVYNCAAGITIASEVGATLSRVKVYNNLIYDCRPSVGIRLAGYLDNGPLNDVEIYQNTIVRCGNSSASAWENCGILVEADNPLNSNFVIRNNILSQNTRAIRTKNQSYLTIDRNLIDGPLQSGVAGNTSVQASPQFIDAANNNFRLAANSPAIDAAVAPQLALLDLDDNSRPSPGPGSQVSLPDLGAFEWIESSQPTTTTLTSTANPSHATGVVTFTATVTANSGVPAGSVSFYDGAVLLGVNTLGASGTTTLTTSTLAIGSHSITGVYSATSGNFAASTSPVLLQNIIPSPLAPWVRAYFTDGTGISLPHQYFGSAGEGWLGGWTSLFGAAGVQSSPPLTAGSGNYLASTRDTGSGPGSQGGVYRRWDTAVRPENQFSRLTFDFRGDSDATFNNSGDGYGICLNNTATASPGGGTSVYLRCFGASPGNDFFGNPITARKWYVFKGTLGVTDAYATTRFVPTGVSATPGVTCSFTIDVYAASGPGTTNGKTHGTFDVTVTNGTESSTVLGSGFRTNLYTSGSYLAFATQQNDANDDLAFSVDSINLAPQNAPPVVAAGSDPSIILPAGATLTGTATDDGLPVPSTLTTSWTKVSGPGSVSFGDSAALATTATFSASGNYVLRLTGNDGSLTAIDDLTVTALDPEIIQPHQAWRIANFTPAQLANPELEASIWGNLADPDADGSANILEYAFNTDPKRNSSVFLAVCNFDPDGHLTLTFPRVADPALLYELLGSDALEDWTPVWSSTGIQNTVGDVTATDTALLSLDRRFLRLKVTLPSD